MKIKAIHSSKRTVYHNNSNCTEANNIEKENIRQGTGNKTLCLNCKKLNSK
jgi:hypothetical protein